jgi:hypothetical protein
MPLPAGKAMAETRRAFFSTDFVGFFLRAVEANYRAVFCLDLGLPSGLPDLPFLKPPLPVLFAILIDLVSKLEIVSG